MFCHHFSEDVNFCDFLLISLTTKPFKNGSALKKKNLLLEEQILSFKSWLPLRREAKVKNGRVASPESEPLQFFFSRVLLLNLEVLWVVAELLLFRPQIIPPPPFPKCIPWAFDRINVGCKRERLRPAFGQAPRL